MTVIYIMLIYIASKDHMKIFLGKRRKKREYRINYNYFLDVQSHPGLRNLTLAYITPNVFLILQDCN